MVRRFWVSCQCLLLIWTIVGQGPIVHAVGAGGGCFAIIFFRLSFLFSFWGWSGCAMALGKLPVPGRPTIWIAVGQGPIALAVGGGWFGHFYSHLSFLLFLSLFGRRLDMD